MVRGSYRKHRDIYKIQHVLASGKKALVEKDEGYDAFKKRNDEEEKE